MFESCAKLSRSLTQGKSISGLLRFESCAKLSRSLTSGQFKSLNVGLRVVLN